MKPVRCGCHYECFTQCDVKVTSMQMAMICFYNCRFPPNGVRKVFYSSRGGVKHFLGGEHSLSFFISSHKGGWVGMLIDRIFVCIGKSH